MGNMKGHPQLILVEHLDHHFRSQIETLT